MQLKLILILTSSVLAAVAAVLGITVFAATNAVETDDVISNALFAIENEVDGAYTSVALEAEFGLGKQLCTSFCVAAATEQDAMQKAQISGIVGATCSCSAACLCSGYEDNFKTYLAGGSEQLAAMGGMSSALSKLTWSKKYDVHIGVTGMTAKISGTKLSDAPDINPRLTDTTILATEAGMAAPAYGGFAAIISSQWDALVTTFGAALEEFDMASLTPDEAIVHQHFTGDNKFASEEYGVLVTKEFASKATFAYTAPLGATGPNPDYPSKELEYKNDWYARLVYDKEKCPLKSEEYTKRKYSISVNGNPVPSDYNPSERVYGGVSEHDSNYSHCDACESAPQMIKTMKLLGILSSAVFCAMSLARLKLGGNVLRFGSLIFGLLGVVAFVVCALKMPSCATAIKEQSANYRDYNEAIGLLVPDSLTSTATTKTGSPFYSVVASSILVLVASILGGVIKYSPGNKPSVTPASAPSKDSAV